MKATASVLYSVECEFIAAPTSAVILVVIGYRMNFIGVAWKKISKVIVLRLVQQGIMAALVFAFLKTLGGIFAEPLTLISVIVMLILPPPFIVPLYVEGEEKKESLFISDFGIHDGINCRIYDFIRSSFAVICQMKTKGSARCRTL